MEFGWGVWLARYAGVLGQAGEVQRNGWHRAVRRVELPPGRKFEPDRWPRRREIGKKGRWGQRDGGGGPRKIFFRPCGVGAGRDEHVPRMLGLGSSDPPKKVTFQHSHDRKKVRAPKKFTILYGTARSGKFPIVNFQAVQRAPILNFFWDRNCVGRLYMGEDLFWGPGGQTPKGCWRSSGPAVKVTCYFGATWRLLASGRAMSGPRTCLRPPLDNLEYQSSGQRG